jgi:hypothetical protein
MAVSRVAPGIAELATAAPAFVAYSRISWAGNFDISWYWGSIWAVGCVEEVRTS